MKGLRFCAVLIKNKPKEWWKNHQHYQASCLDRSPRYFTVLKHKTRGKGGAPYSKCFKSWILYHTASKEKKTHKRHSDWVPAQPLAPGCPDGVAKPAGLLNPRKHVGLLLLLECCYSPAVSIWHISLTGPQPAGTAQNSLGATLE